MFPSQDFLQSLKHSSATAPPATQTQVIVRIGPNEIHLSDPENYDIIYIVGNTYHKDPEFYSVPRAPCMFTAITNEEHRRRRAPLKHFFSRRAVLDLEGVVRRKAGMLCDRFQKEFSRAGESSRSESGIASGEH